LTVHPSLVPVLSLNYQSAILLDLLEKIKLSKILKITY